VLTGGQARRTTGKYIAFIVDFSMQRQNTVEQNTTVEVSECVKSER